MIENIETEKNRILKNRSLYILLFTCGLIAFSSFKPTGQLLKFRIAGSAQGTTYNINYYDSSQSVSKPQIDSILTAIDSSLSIYKPYSLISSFNNSKTGVKMDVHLRNVLSKSADISKKSKGAFDITVYPLVTAWGFGPEKAGELPDEAKITTILKNVGYRYLKVKDAYLFKKKPDVKIDVNGIAQGYSVDVIANFLEAKGIHSYVVELGGELRIKGKKPSDEFFKIGIESVNDHDYTPITKYIEIENGAITTSGNYRKFHQLGNQKINHLINPKTGYYLNNELISVTVFAKDAITADGYDNVLMNLGLRKALDFLKKSPEIAAYFVYQKNGVVKDTCSNGFPTIKNF